MNIKTVLNRIDDAIRFLLRDTLKFVLSEDERGKLVWLM
jgi:hypothetical protein